MNLHSPYGKLILHSHQESEVLKNPALQERLAALIDLIKYRTEKKGIVETSVSLHDELFNIRIELVSHLFNQPEILELFETKILEEIADKYFHKGANKHLGNIMADSLHVYLEIFSKLTDYFKTEQPDFPLNEIPSFEAFKFALSLQPAPEMNNYLKWLESSLNFDYALIAADFFLLQEIQLNNDQTKKLEIFLEETIIDFASYSVIMGLWDLQPQTKDLPYSGKILKRINYYKSQIPGYTHHLHSDTTQKENTARDFSGVWSIEDAALIEKAIKEGCEQIDEDGWK